MTHVGTVRAVLFDLDGTLLDTAPDMIGALEELLDEAGQARVPFGLARGYVSHGAARLVRLGFPDAPPERLAALQTRYLELYRDGISRKTRLFAGMAEVLQRMAQWSMAAGVVTNKPAWLTEPLLEQLGLRERLACVVSGDTVAERKPHPLPLLHAAALAGVAAAQCVYVGDAERDIQAARAAGMPAIVATYGYLQSDEDWRTWGGDAAIDRPLELIPWLDARRLP